MLGKTVAVAVVALTASQATALNLHRHKHPQRDAAQHLALANQERALMEERALLYAHTTTTVTTEWYTVYVTVDGDEEATATAAASGIFFETESSSSPPAAETTADSVVEDTGPGENAGDHYAAPTTSSTSTTPAADPSTEAPVVEPSTTLVTYTSAAPEESEVETTSTTSSAPAATSSTTSSGNASSGKRGVAYNDAAIGQTFADSSSVTWGYNWGSDGSLDSAEYIPMCWGPKDSFVEVWPANAQAAIDNGAAHLLSMNEPDLPGQSYDYLDKDDTGTVNSAVTLHKSIMSDFVGSAEIGSPAVCSDYNANGRSCNYDEDGCEDEPITDYDSLMSYHWLKAFINTCGDDCPLDFVVTHFYSYSSDCPVSDLTDYIDLMHAAIPDYPIWVTEIGAPNCDDASASQFIADALAYMDSSSVIGGYSYFYADGVLSDGSSMSTLGTTYVDS
ncbi:glycosyl hydrolase catalytic core-domain-containing protein [Zalerion maritima]|uniref:Glycosyl hydrolase catalytic core-domain-containing protein n=1 Tax=Zalerion maritima TaxID=339359 RepID=A0AAD5RF16_9PEZI|nr:glycosyl hydrolase catalytic core-domain-containing protein [Zalerion maritima]